jgi:hypothetical protein
MMKVRKPIMSSNSCMQISNTLKKNIAQIFENNIENILKLKRIIKFNMIMIIFFLPKYL